MGEKYEGEIPYQTGKSPISNRHPHPCAWIWWLADKFPGEDAFVAHMTELVKDWPETHKGQAVLTAVIQRSELLCMRDVALRDSLKQPPFSTCVQKLLWLVRGLAASWAAETH